MNSRMIFFQLLLGVVLIFSSCKKNVNKIASTGWNPSLAVPLGEANFLISDLLKNVDSGIVVGPLGEMSIAFEETVDSISASDLITLDNYTQNFDLTPSGLAATPVFPSGNTISASSPISTSYTAPNGVEIHDLNFSNGQLVLSVSSDFQHDVHLVFTLNDLIINGSPFTQTMDLIYTGSLPVTGMVSVPLAGASADFTAGNTLVNSLTGSVDATVTASGNPGNPILGTEKLSLDLSLNNLGYDNITGYFGQQTLANLTDSILFKLFQNSEMSGNIAFSNPSMTFNIENSFGVPVDINLGSFQSIDSISGQVTNMVLSNNVLSVNTPVTMGQTATTSFTIDRNNMTNIESLIGTKPRYMKFNIAATTNPAGKTGTLNFLEASSKILIKAELELPFEGSASGITAGDTLDFNFDNNIDIVESVMFRLNVDNGFPVSFKAQATFVDQNYQPIFTLFTSPKEVVTAAPVNSSTGRVTGKVKKITDLTIDADKTKQLNLVKYIIIEGTVDTTDPDNTNVKFYDDYSISLKLGMQVNLKK
jgi:hypothetical protein